MMLTTRWFGELQVIGVSFACAVLALAVDSARSSAKRLDGG